jgi:hypothetical protein
LKELDIGQQLPAALAIRFQYHRALQLGEKVT